MKTLRILALIVTFTALVNSAGAVVLDRSAAPTLEEAEEVCVDHFSEPYMRYDEWGLWGLSPDVRTKGDFAYLFDGDVLDCIDCSDPLATVPIPYQPTIVLIPNPEKLMKVGRDHLYAFQPGAMSVIDISTPDSPVLVSTDTSLFAGMPYSLGNFGDHIGFFDDAQLKFLDVSVPGTPTLAASIPAAGTSMPRSIAMLGIYAYFFDNGTLKIVDFSDTSTPVLASSTSIVAPESYYHLFTFWYARRVFLLFGAYPSSLAIVNVETPSSPSVHYGDWLQEPFYPDFMSAIVGAYLADDAVVVTFSDLPGSWTKCYDVSDPDSWAECSSSWPDPPVELPHGAVEGDRIFWGTSGSLEWPYVIGSVHPATAEPFSYEWRYPFEHPVIADNALIFTTMMNEPNWPGGVQGKLRILARQCEYPQIIANSIDIDRSYSSPDNLVWEITWETDMYTSPELDSVVIRDQGSNPPGGAIGTVTLTGAGTVEAQASGTYLHTVIYDYGECVPNCSYYVDVNSTRTNHTATSSDNLVRIKKCAASKTPGNITVECSAPPN